MPKTFRYLIIIWTVVCASGLGIFLFQLFGPSITPQTGYDNKGIVIAVILFIFLWAAPVAIAAVKGRQAGRKTGA